MDFWLDLTQAYLFNGNAAYVTELINQLASWSQQNPALADPNTWAANDPHWNLLDTSIRAESWAWAYQMISNDPAWTADANTLFLYKLYQHGDFLRKVTPYDLASNRALFHAKGLLTIAQLMPKFTGAADWETYSRGLLFNAMDAQLYNDGGHVEASPGYTANVVDDLLEAYWLDQQKSDAAQWPAPRVTKLTNAMDSYIQILSPNGALPALSDTYRNTALTMLLKARITLGNTAYPAAKPRMRDVWLFGSATAQTHVAAPVNPALPDRGKTFAMPDTGYYIMRSGVPSDSRQLTFDAGATGGVHGHFDLLNFELFGYGRALISDPGLYIYDNANANRQYVISTRAHNTINVDLANHAALEGSTNPGFKVDQWQTDANHAHITAHHYGYSALAGGPVLSRSIWYDLDGTALIVDWAEATTTHTYQISFNLPVDPSDPTNSTGNVTGVQPDNSFRSKWGAGNVQVSPMLQTGQSVSRKALTFVSNAAPPNESDPAYRFTVTGTGAFQTFATLLTAYSGSTAPATTAQLLTTNPQPGQSIVIRLTRGGVDTDITFDPPNLERPSANFNNLSGSSNDIAWDAAGKLHMAFFDRSSRTLKYSVRDAAGKWSIIQTVDPGLDCGVYLSLALDSNGVPGIAYFDGNNGDLKYARLTSGAWKTEKVDGVGSVGLYPTLVFSRTNGPLISYYHRTKGDLRLASTISSGWTITTVDSAGDVGRSGMMLLDPNRPTASKVAICYEDTTHGDYKYAIQSGTGWKIQFIDQTTLIGGGYMSMAFSPVADSAGVYQPSVSYYDAGNSALKFAVTNGLTWSTKTIASAGKQGLYTNLIYDNAGVASIFYFDKSFNRAWRAKGGFKSMTLTSLGSGGRELQVARKTTGALAWTNLDESIPQLSVAFLAS